MQRTLNPLIESDRDALALLFKQNPTVKHFISSPVSVYHLTMMDESSGFEEKYLVTLTHNIVKRPCANVAGKLEKKGQSRYEVISNDDAMDEIDGEYVHPVDVTLVLLPRQNEFGHLIVEAKTQTDFVLLHERRAAEQRGFQDILYDVFYGKGTVCTSQFSFHFIRKIDEPSENKPILDESEEKRGSTL